ncbi:hypothetical protein [Sphingomonas hankookensis]|uniref:hypothetical protein n=1 Tax=Sphingomonas hankookensis TaxID=563996 RepID=UPI003D302F5D
MIVIAFILKLLRCNRALPVDWQTALVMTPNAGTGVLVHPARFIDRASPFA